MFTVKYGKRTPRKPRIGGLKFDKGGFVQEGPFDKFLSPYDKMRRSENVEDRGRSFNSENSRNAGDYETPEEVTAAKQKYLDNPAPSSPLGVQAGLKDLPARASSRLYPVEQSLVEAEKKAKPKKKR